MYKDDVRVINIQANQLNGLVNQVLTGCMSMVPIAEEDPTDKDALKAYVASVDILMASLQSQQVLLQQALDKLAKELAG